MYSWLPSLHPLHEDEYRLLELYRTVNEQSNAVRFTRLPSKVASTCASYRFNFARLIDGKDQDRVLNSSLCGCPCRYREIYMNRRSERPGRLIT